MDSIEFRAVEDDSWYDVRLALNGDTLVILYHHFPKEKVEFKACEFTTVEDLKLLKQRFRSLSSPLQDNECSTVVRGTSVCASHSFCNSDLYFYDAIVEEVLRKEHSVENGEELCNCKFLVYWTHGPGEGNQAIKSVESICLIQSGNLINPTLASFFNMIKEKMSGRPHSFSDFEFPKLQRVDNHRTEDNVSDIGSGHHVILIENLEKDISPVAIMEFIDKHISIPTLACVFPSYAMEHYARGALMLSSEKDLETLFHFLENPDHLVVSSRGRPWVVPEQIPKLDEFVPLAGSLMLKAQELVQGRIVGSADLKLVHSGTKEYDIAKELKAIFCEYIDHQKWLHHRLNAMQSRRSH